MKKILGIFILFLYLYIFKCIVKITICHITDIQGNQSQKSLAGKLGKFLKLLCNLLFNIQFYINVLIPLLESELRYTYCEGVDNHP